MKCEICGEVRVDLVQCILVQSDEQARLCPSCWLEVKGSDRPIERIP